MNIIFIRNIIIALLLTFSCNAFAQWQEDIDRGDKAFNDRNFELALSLFESANEKKPGQSDITRRIAQTYARMGQINISAEWYRRTIELGSDDPTDMIKYAEALRNLQQYDEAVLWYEKFLMKRPNDIRSKSHTSDPEYFEDLFADTAQYSLKSLKMNNENPVMGITMFEPTKFIVSGINVEGKADPKGKKTYLQYLDLYYMNWEASDELTNPVPLGKPANTKLHDGPAFFCKFDNTLYITRNAVLKGKASKASDDVSLKIMACKWNMGNWSSPQELKINGFNSSSGHPTISADGQIMVFVSNRDGGFGGTDLYMAVRQGDSWTDPINLGNQINTEGNEMFPFISEDGVLFFSSDGLAGLGGLDLFYAKQAEGKWSKPTNLGAPVNSFQDDFGLLYDAKTDRGFFVSNRSGKGNDDLFYYTHKSILEQIVAGRIKVDDKAAQGVPENVTVVNVTSGEVAQQRLSPKGNFQIIGQKGEEYAVYMSNKDAFDVTVPVFSYKIPDVIVDPYVNLGQKEVKPIKPYTAKAYAFDLKEQPLPAVRTSISDNLKSSMNDKKQPKPAVDLAAMGINNVLFGYNSAVLQEKEAAKVEQVKTIMKEKSTTKLIVRAFCDSRGSFEYNKKLSINRANAVKSFLVSKGIDANRVKVEWFGEDNPLNDCGDVKKCTEDEYSMNRRAEMILVESK